MHIGQAGTQVGIDFWKLILNESGSIQEDIFFDRIRNTARGILVDSEPKVIKSV